MQIFRLKGYIAHQILHLFSRNKREKNDEVLEIKSLEDLSQTISDEIINTNIDPNQVILKQSNTEQAQLFLELVNDKLKQGGKSPIPQNNDTYHFHQVSVNKYVEKPENKDIVLDTVFIKPNNPSGKYIINCAARGRSYLDWLGDMTRDADMTNATVVGFNYRSLGLSSGTLISQQDVIDDIVAQVKYLIKEKHAAPKDINLYGLCLGGAFATLAAAQLKKEGIDVKLYVSRTFKRFDQTIVDLVMPRKYDNWPVYILKILFFPLLLPISFLFKAYVWSLGWQVNINKAIKTLAPENIEYDFAEPSKTDAQQNYIGDKIILSSNSPYDLIQDKLAKHALKQAALMINEEKEEKMKPLIQLGLDWAFGQDIDKWTEEGALSMLLKLEKVINDLDQKANLQNTPIEESQELREELTRLKAIQKGLCLARVCCQLAHQVARKSPDEKRWNPHASPSDRLKAYGFEGDQRSRLFWFVNRTDSLSMPHATETTEENLCMAV